MKNARTKICTVCKRSLPYLEFRAEKTERGGWTHGNVCYECEKKAKLGIREEEEAHEPKKFVSAKFVKQSKTCRKCKKRKHLCEFPTDVNLDVYANSVCNECRKTIEKTIEI